jgi:hypothetical protein
MLKEVLFKGLLSTGAGTEEEGGRLKKMGRVKMRGEE